MAKRTDYERAERSGEVAYDRWCESGNRVGLCVEDSFMGGYTNGYLAGLRAARREKAKANNKKAGK
jgi:hypothetical protein